MGIWELVVNNWWVAVAAYAVAFTIICAGTVLDGYREHRKSLAESGTDSGTDDGTGAGTDSGTDSESDSRNDVRANLAAAVSRGDSAGPVVRPRRVDRLNRVVPGGAHVRTDKTPVA